MKNLYLLDTNILSEIRKPQPNENLLKFFLEKRIFSAISSITWAESLAGLNRMNDGKKKEALSIFYHQIVGQEFEILPFDQRASVIYGDLYPRLEAIGKIPQDFDLQIASIAIANNLILVTRNTRDFESIQEVSNLMVENWFETD